MTSILQDVIVQLRLFQEASVHTSRTANRTVYKFTLGDNEYTMTRRDLTEPDGYERTEVFRLLCIVRACELAQGFRCPRPSRQEIRGMARRMLTQQVMP